MKTVKLFTLVFFTNLVCLAQTKCPPQGEGRNVKEQTLNQQKNRDYVITAGTQMDTISIDSILKPGNDLKRFSVTQIVTVTGYVVLQKYGGSESCNCHSKSKTGWDIHLEIGKNPTDKGNKCFIAEVSPKFPNRESIDWKSFVGKKVEITGYIFYDVEHTQNAVNTNPTGTNLWRATIVEIHPVINIKIIN